MQIGPSVYLIPRGKKTIFSSTPATLDLDLETGRLIARGGSATETIDMKTSRAKASFGTVRFPFMNNAKNSLWKGPTITLYNPKLQLLSWLFALPKVGAARELAASLNQHSRVAK
jgi:hypothetical protein